MGLSVPGSHAYMGIRPPLFSMSPHQPIQFILKLVGTIDIKFTLTCVFIISQSRIKIFNLVTLRIWRTQCEMY